MPPRPAGHAVHVTSGVMTDGLSGASPERRIVRAHRHDELSRMPGPLHRTGMAYAARTDSGMA